MKTITLKTDESGAICKLIDDRLFKFNKTNPFNVLPDENDPRYDEEMAKINAEREILKALFPVFSPHAHEASITDTGR